jgi:hypothetical protein
MSRTLEFKDSMLILHLKGLTSTAALKRHVEIPFSSIDNASVEDFKVALLNFRVGTSIGDIREGIFYTHNDWCFISYENHKEVVVLDLNNHEFGKVVFQIENPYDTQQMILEHISKK